MKPSVPPAQMHQGENRHADIHTHMQVSDLLPVFNSVLKALGREFGRLVPQGKQKVDTDGEKMKLRMEEGCKLKILFH